MPKTVILGGGISGLLAAHAFRGRGTTLIERSAKLGGTYLDGGLKYIRATPAVKQLATLLGVPWRLKRQRGAVLMFGELLPHPGWMRSLKPEIRRAIQRAHWIKTRGNESGFQETCMNDPMGEGEALSIEMDHAAFMEALVGRAIAFGTTFITGANVESVITRPDSMGLVQTATEGVFWFDKLVNTLPLGVARRVFINGKLPEAKAAPLTIVHAKSLPPWLYRLDAASFDYIYTPDWAMAHRLSRTKSGWDVEISGSWPEPDVVETNLEKMGSTSVTFAAGHLLQPEHPIVWSDEVLALGRFAEWNGRSTVEKSLDRLLAWGGRL